MPDAEKIEREMGETRRPKGLEGGEARRLGEREKVREGEGGLEDARCRWSDTRFRMPDVVSQIPDVKFQISETI